MDDKLILDNLKLVPFLIGKYIKISQAHPEYQDYYQEGCVGLVQAASRFDSCREVKFSSYASKYIVGHLYNYKYQYLPMIKYPRRRVSNLKKLAKYRHDNPDASFDDMLSDLDLSIDEIIECSGQVGYFEDDSEYSIMDMSLLDVPDRISYLSAIDIIDDVVASKIFQSDKCNKIFKHYISDIKSTGRPHTGQWYADKYQCSRSNISMVIRKGRSAIKVAIEDSNRIK